jgi:hypothetical protein
MENGKWFGKKENVVKQKSCAFALRAVKLAKYLQGEKKEFVLSKPVLDLHKLNYQWLAENNEQGKTESARLSDMYVRVR